MSTDGGGNGIDYVPLVVTTAEFKGDQPGEFIRQQEEDAKRQES